MKGKHEMEGPVSYLIRRAIQRCGIQGKPWTGAVPRNLSGWLDFLFLRHEYMNYQGWLVRAAPSDWAESLYAICDGKRHVRQGHSLKSLWINIVMFQHAHRLNLRRAQRSTRPAE